jgi:hypothetical protein
MTGDPDELDGLDPAVEWRLRAWAVPGALAIALVFNLSPTGHMVQRTFLTMIPHELGHAVTGWWCGLAAVPGLWKTLIPETRSAITVVAIAALELGLAVHGWRQSRIYFVAIVVVLAATQFVATSGGLETAHTVITFGGDAGALVIGTLLVLTFFAPAGSRLRAGALRWGLLAIGAAAYVDVAMTWWRARADHSQIPFGEIEGVGLSDPSKLLEANWSPALIVRRYLLVAGLCLATILIAWVWQTWRMRALARRSRQHD